MAIQERIQEVFSKFYKGKSIPFKPYIVFRKDAEYPHNLDKRLNQDQTVRQLTALLIAVICNDIEIKEGAKIPRTFTLNGDEIMFENGVANDMITSKMVTFEYSRQGPAFLIFILTQIGAEALNKYKSSLQVPLDTIHS